MLIWILFLATVKILAAFLLLVQKRQFVQPFLCPEDVIGLFGEQTTGAHELMHLSKSTHLLDDISETAASFERLRANATVDIADEQLFVWLYYIPVDENHYRPARVSDDIGVLSEQLQLFDQFTFDLLNAYVYHRVPGLHQLTMASLSSVGDILLREIVSYRRSMIPLLLPWWSRQPADLLGAFVYNLDVYGTHLHHVKNLFGEVNATLDRLQHVKVIARGSFDEHTQKDQDKRTVDSIHTGLLSECRRFAENVSTLLERLDDQVKRRRELVHNADRQTCSPFALSAGSVYRSRELGVLLQGHHGITWRDE